MCRGGCISSSRPFASNARGWFAGRLPRVLLHCPVLLVDFGGTGSATFRVGQTVLAKRRYIQWDKVHALLQIDWCYNPVPPDLYRVLVEDWSRIYRGFLPLVVPRQWHVGVEIKVPSPLVPLRNLPHLGFHLPVQFVVIDPPVQKGYGRRLCVRGEERSSVRPTSPGRCLLAGRWTLSYQSPTQKSTQKKLTKCLIDKCLDLECSKLFSFLSSCATRFCLNVPEQSATPYLKSQTVVGSCSRIARPSHWFVYVQPFKKNASIPHFHWLVRRFGRGPSRA